MSAAEVFWLVLSIGCSYYVFLYGITILLNVCIYFLALSLGAYLEKRDAKAQLVVLTPAFVFWALFEWLCLMKTGVL